MHLFNGIFLIFKLILCQDKFYNIRLRKYPISEYDRESIKININKELKKNELLFNNTLFGFRVKISVSDKLKIQRMNSCEFDIEEDYETKITNYKIIEKNFINNKLNNENIIINQLGAPKNLTILSKSLNYKKTNKYRFPSDGGSNNVNVYVLDTGIGIKHYEFNSKLNDYKYNRVSMVNNFTEEEIMDDFNGHGTHVSGIIGGTTYGVAKGVIIKGIKVLNGDGKGTTSSLINGLYYVLEEHIKNNQIIENIKSNDMIKDIEDSINYLLQHIDNNNSIFKEEILNSVSNSLNKHLKKVYTVINISLGGPSSKILNDTLELLNKHNIFIIVAAGNDNSNACKYSPSNSPNVITVGALNDNIDNIAEFSNKGKCVDIFAPGTNIRSSYYENGIYLYKSLSGTSMATPHVTGVVALYLSQLSNINNLSSSFGLKNNFKKNDLISPQFIKEIIINHSRKLDYKNQSIFNINSNKLNIISIRQLLKLIRRENK